jgi:hypothetical protein
VSLGRLLVGFGLILSGCGGDADAPRSQADGLQLELVGRYGSLDGELALQQIRYISMDPDGQRLYVTQNGVGSILILSAAGDSIGVLGRPGDGPGEFRGPGPAHVWSDTVWIPNSAGPVSAFSGAGAYLRDLGPFREPLPGELRPPTFMGFLEDGSILLEGGINMNQAANGQQPTIQFMRADRSGTPLEVLGHRSLEGGFFVTAPEERRVVIGLHPAASWDLRCLDPQGRWLVSVRQRLDDVEEPELTVSWIAPEGDTLRSTAVGIRGVSSERARAAWVAEFAEWSGAPVGQVERLSETSLTWPEYLPAGEVTCDQDGRTWIQTPHEHADSATWIVHDDRGGRLGSLVLGSHVRLNTALGEDVWGWAPGAYDEPYVLKFRLSGL